MRSKSYHLSQALAVTAVSIGAYPCWWIRAPWWNVLFLSNWCSCRPSGTHRELLWNPTSGTRARNLVTLPGRRGRGWGGRDDSGGRLSWSRGGFMVVAVVAAEAADAVCPRAPHPISFLSLLFSASQPCTASSPLSSKVTPRSRSPARTS
jgi:hypothetical protein